METVLLDGDLGAGLFELGLGSVGSVLGDLLEDRLRSTLDEVLGFLQAQARDELADDLDDLDLLVAGTLEDDVELVLLGLGLSGTGSRGTGSSNGDRSSSGDLEGLLECLHELRELEQGQFLERVEQLFGGELRHGGGPSW